MSKMGEFILEVCEMYDCGFTPEEIADRTSISSKMAYTILENHSDSFKQYVSWLEEQEKRL